MIVLTDDHSVRLPMGTFLLLGDSLTYGQTEEATGATLQAGKVLRVRDPSALWVKSTGESTLFQIGTPASGELKQSVVIDPPEGGLPLELKAHGKTLLRLRDIAAEDDVASVVQFFGGTATTSMKWEMGLDVAAEEPYRDLFIAKVDFPEPGKVNDFLFFNHRGESHPTLNIGGAPNDAGAQRLNVQVPFKPATTEAVEPGMAGLRVSGASDQTAPVFATKEGFSSTDLVRLNVDASAEFFAPSGDRKRLFDGASARIDLFAGSISQVIFTTRQGDPDDGGDEDPRWTIDGDGTLAWGDGSGATDASFGRGNASQLVADNTEWVVQRSAGSSRAFAARQSGDASLRWQVRADGQMFWGTGAALDTDLIRHAAKVLRSNGKIVTTDGLGAGNSVAKTTLASPGTVVRMLEVFDAAGASIGAVPVYSTGAFS